MTFQILPDRAKAGLKGKCRVTSVNNRRNTKKTQLRIHLKKLQENNKPILKNKEGSNNKI